MGQFVFGTSWLVPWEPMTLTKIETYKMEAINIAIDRAIRLALATDERGLMVRTFRAFADLGVGTVNEDEWGFNLAAGLNAGQINIAVPANQIMVFYGIDDYDANPVATLVTFRTALIGGTTKMQVDLQTCRGFTYCAGMLSEPIVYDRLDQVVVDIQSDAAHAPEMILFMGYVVTPRGAVVS